MKSFGGKVLFLDRSGDGISSRPWTDKTQEWKSEAATLMVQAAEARRMREQSPNAQGKLEQRLKALTAEHASLQEELDRRNRADRVLAARRQELETSKNVLELHVQARTQELQKFQRRYELILNSAGEGILGFDVEGKTTFVNPAVEMITGWSVAQLAGKTEVENFGDECQKPGDAMAGRSAGEKIFRRRDGSTFPGEYVLTSIHEDGRVVVAVLVFKDITERKASDETLTQKAAELARSNSELEQFAFVASHGTRRPPLGVRGPPSSTPEEAAAARRACGPAPPGRVTGGGVDTHLRGDPERFRRASGVRDPYLLYVGRLDEGKNTHVAMAYAGAWARRRGGGERLVQLGRGPLGLPAGEPALVAAGVLDEQGKMDACAGALALCQPSVNESFSRVLMEAWLNEVPVLVHADCAVTVGHCRRSGGGLWFRDFLEFAGAADLLAGEERLRRSLGEAGRRYVLAECSCLFCRSGA